MSPLVRTTYTLAATMIGGLVSAPAANLEGLVKNSPFGGSGVAAAPGAAPSILEFRGMYTEGGVHYFSIYNSQTKQSSWVRAGEAPSTNVPVTVKAFDPVNETLDVDNGGQNQQMTLHQSNVVTYRGPSPAQMAAVAASASVAPAAPVAEGEVTRKTRFGGMQAELTPAQVEAFRQQMRERMNRRGGEAGGNAQGGNNNGGEANANPNRGGKVPKNR